MKIDSAELARAAYRKEDLVVDELPQVAFIGRSNVGKSSLMNALLGRKGLARTSSTPGRTRSVNYFLVNRRFYFVDLPGYGYAKAGKQERQGWADLIDAYFRDAARPERRERVLVVQLVDSKVGVTRLDEEAHEYLRGFRLETTVVATKVDRLKSNERPRALAAVGRALGLAGEGGAVAVSAQTAEGVKPLWRALDRHLAAGAQ